MGRGLAPLRQCGFGFLLAGQSVSYIGDNLYVVALPWYVLASHGGVVLLGTALAAYGIPRTVMIAVGGHASDRWRPWTVMLASDDLEYAAAARAFGDVIMPALTRRALDTIARRDLWPEGWRKGVLGQDVSVLYLTPDEAREVEAEMRVLTARHGERAGHPGLRPADAIPVEFLTFAYPLLHLLGVPAGERVR